MRKKVNLRLIAAIALSLADEIIIIVVLALLLPLIGIEVPLWALIVVGLAFLALSFIIYRALQKSPQLGFENMIGKTGIAVEPINRKGTVKIDGELWSASTRGSRIEPGTEIIVVEQTGLKLTVTGYTGPDRVD